jgi:hypothetical protein
MPENVTLQELQKSIATQAIKDDAFRSEFLSNPRAAIEKYSGQKLPADVQVHAHLQSTKNVHFVIPDKKAIEGEVELTDEDLDKVAGGEFFITIAVLGTTIGVVSAAASIANDQTRARAGW